ncbi:MAG: DUF1207 domain-containing protein [Planctomycetaceae bacterium]|nr:DUF1207 domain-containing protein [Planctomycetaceae bacterium]
METRTQIHLELLAFRDTALRTLAMIALWWLVVSQCPGGESPTAIAGQRVNPGPRVDPGQRAGNSKWPVDANAPQLLKEPAPTSAFAFPPEAESSPLVDSILDQRGTIRLDYFPSLAERSNDSRVPVDQTSLSQIIPETTNEVLPTHGTHTNFVSFRQLFDDPAKYSPCETGWQLLPDGLLYKTYLAGYKEPRIQYTNLFDTHSKRRVTEAVLGGRVGIVRYGTFGANNPQGFQLDLDGAVFARVLPDEVSTMLEGADFRVGLTGTWRHGPLAARTGYYHISSHVGDEFLLANPMFNRINYVRDSLLFGLSYDVNSDITVYSELGAAPGTQGGAKMFELQFGGQYTPIATRPSNGAPYVGIHTHLREEFNFNGSLNVVAGWGWQGPTSRRRLRVGMMYYTGPSMQFSFFDRYENLLGGGIWFDY